MSNEKVTFYPLGWNTINLAPNLILVNGTPVARTFQDFTAWIVVNQVDIQRFKNWPFIEGVSEPIRTHVPTINKRRRRRA